MRILVSDQRSKIRSALRLLLEQEPDLRVVGEVSDIDSLMTSVRDNHPDLVLLDWEMTKRQETEILLVLRKLLPGIKVIALSANPEVSSLALKAGADAFVCKCDPADRLLAAMSAI
ncbi:MAG: response regulator transcription factor [Anaerolineaceae bacterium]|nr:MAG: response regulator transcription factor [Anaerolineaceae bacterium]